MEATLQSNITAIGTNQYGHKVAISLKSNRVDIYNVADMKPIAQIVIPDATPNSVDFSSNELGSLLAVGLSDGSVRVYAPNGNSYTEAKRLGPQKAAVLSVSFHPSRKLIAAASLDGTFAIYSCESGSEWKSTFVPSSILGTTCVAWGASPPDNLNLVTLFVGGVDGVIRVYKSNGNGWEMNASAQVHNGWVRRIAIPISSNSLLQKLATCSEDNTAGVLALSDNDLSVRLIQSEGSPIIGVSWAMVDKTLVLSHADGTVTYWTQNGDGWVKSQ